MPAVLVNLILLGLVASITPLGVLGLFAVTGGGKRSNAIAFVAGWATIVGLFAVVGAFVVHGRVKEDTDPSTVLNIALVVMGAALIALAFRTRAKAATQDPHAESALDVKLRGLGGRGSFLAGVAMAPYPVGLAAGAILMQAKAGNLARFIELLVFLTVTTWTMLLIIAVLYRGSPAMRARLDRAHDWVGSHRSHIAFYLLLVLGIVIIVPALRVLLG